MALDLKEHRRRLGPAAFLFFYLALRATVTQAAQFPNFYLVDEDEFPSIKAIANRLGLSVKTVRGQLLRLQAHGYIAFEESQFGVIIAVNSTVWNTQNSPPPDLADLPLEGMIQ